jgi:membrane-bound lytic murein transglycosylase B
MDRDIETQRMMDLAALLANRTSPSRDLATRIAPTRRPVEAAEVLTGETWEEWLEDITRSLVAHGVPRDVAENHVQTEFGGVVEHRPTLAAA